MQFDWPIVELQDIAAIRVRRGWRGKLVLQVRHPRQMKRPKQFGGDISMGLGPWRDASADNPEQVAAICSRLTPNAGGEPPAPGRLEQT